MINYCFTELTTTELLGGRFGPEKKNLAPPPPPKFPNSPQAPSRPLGPSPSWNHPPLPGTPPPSWVFQKKSDPPPPPGASDSPFPLPEQRKNKKDPGYPPRLNQSLYLCCTMNYFTIKLCICTMSWSESPHAEENQRKTKLNSEAISNLYLHLSNYYP